MGIDTRTAMTWRLQTHIIRRAYVATYKWIAMLTYHTYAQKCTHTHRYAHHMTTCYEERLNTYPEAAEPLQSRRPS